MNTGFWQVVGYCGALTFAGRWAVQLIASHANKQPRFPRLFWHMSLAGSLMLLSYFLFSEKRDPVGVASNLFPTFIAGYNLYLGRNKPGTGAFSTSSPDAAGSVPDAETL